MSAIEEQLAGFYTKLARRIAAMIPVEWDVVYYLGEVEPGKQSWSSVFYFRDLKSGTFVQSNSIPRMYQTHKNEYMGQWMGLNNILLEVYQCFADHGQAPWEQMDFFLDRTGKFRVQYQYDVMHPQDGGQLARELVWAHRAFGYTPEEGTRQRKLLEEHL